MLLGATEEVSIITQVTTLPIKIIYVLYKTIQLYPIHYAEKCVHRHTFSSSLVIGEVAVDFPRVNRGAKAVPLDLRNTGQILEHVRSQGLAEDLV